MDNLDLYQIADKEKIDIESYKQTNSKARIFEINNNYYIGINYNNIDNHTEEKEILAEELRSLFLQCSLLY